MLSSNFQPFADVYKQIIIITNDAQNLLCIYVSDFDSFIYGLKPV